MHVESGPEDFADAEQAMGRLESVLSQEAEKAARESGADDLRVQCWRDIRHSQVEGRDVFIEATITAEASGRPRIAENR